MPAGSSPPGTVEPGELALLVEIGGYWLPISDADLVGASYRAGRLWLQIGPVLFEITTNRGAH